MPPPSLLTAVRRSLFGPRSLRSQGINIENVKPVYDRGSLPWWTRWTYFLVAADLITVTTMCELSWNHWTIWEELPSKTPENVSSSLETKDPSQASGHYVLRPWWQRGFFALTTFTTGIVLGAILLGGRSRIVRRMFIVPSPASASSSTTKPGTAVPGRQVVIQSALHTKNQGVVFPLKRTRLVQSPLKTEMMVGIKDGRGHYSLGLEGAEVNGTKASLWDARKALFTEWYGEKKGQQMFLNSSKVKGA
ncbi:hypothetical protein BD311DRAFT_666890 [Dichomitus squalens]|uniref:Transmembrane protein n=1 Tax=Dichomitus squalens TaxID=114155 RepID=A0A4Q9MIL5_9APHY|nr:hypothetical protein BD311DRAFT_666890 [Dichomitus squalens]